VAAQMVEYTFQGERLHGSALVQMKVDYQYSAAKAAFERSNSTGSPRIEKIHEQFRFAQVPVTGADLQPGPVRRGGHERGAGDPR
jgi:hypothetical protein